MSQVPEATEAGAAPAPVAVDYVASRVFSDPQLAEKIVGLVLENMEVPRGIQLATLASACLSRAIVDACYSFETELQMELPHSVVARSNAEEAFHAVSKAERDAELISASPTWPVEDVEFLVQIVNSGDFGPAFAGATVFCASAPVVVENRKVLPIQFCPAAPSEETPPSEATPGDDEGQGIYAFELDGAKVSLFIQRRTASGLPRLACFATAKLCVASDRLTAWVKGKSTTVVNEDTAEDEEPEMMVFSTGANIQLRSTFRPYDDSAVMGDNLNDMQLEAMMASGYGTSQGTYEKLRTVATFTVCSGRTKPVAMLQLMTQREPGPFGASAPTLLNAAHLHEAFAGLEWY
jgi:hypothetical protein